MALKAEQSERLGRLLSERSEKVSKRWAEVAAAPLKGRLTVAESGRQTTELQVQLQKSFSDGATHLDGPQTAELRAVLTEFSRGRARQGFTATETATSIFALKTALYEIGEVEKGDEKALRDYVAWSAFIDELGLFTFEAFSRAREHIITEQSEQLLELSTPVVKLWEGVVAVPLVGTLDSARAQVVMERLLQALVDTGSPYAIIDITGVPAVDTQVAQHVLKTVMAARLMGAECIISGIRPQIAQTIVALGIEFGDIATKATLADALRHAIRRGNVGKREA
ncbi:STAS domain-containing protein [Catellatospora citrea]|uniref:Polyvinylalcohol dehydrogenase n=1 Tax=Catellatospora citrea TaxID=53366 RepID=A0A8J3P1G6_9ACTN|nr:STAS domain-containing protein [Catellatospora citrea]RKE06190.1 rsbT co-antagonist protein RsbR [Catellatospora citrea]GIG00529.1 polyvinylalcohol dehydrogenase [Catellatospora citrea]